MTSGLFAGRLRHHAEVNTEINLKYARQSHFVEERLIQLLCELNESGTADRRSTWVMLAMPRHKACRDPATDYTAHGRRMFGEPALRRLRFADAPIHFAARRVGGRCRRSDNVSKSAIRPPVHSPVRHPQGLSSCRSETAVAMWTDRSTRRGPSAAARHSRPRSRRTAPWLPRR
jgi:hypothetical protein